MGRSHNNLLPIRIKAMIEAPVITSKGELVSGACVTHATSDLCLTEREGGGGRGESSFLWYAAFSLSKTEEESERDRPVGCTTKDSSLHALRAEDALARGALRHRL